MDCDDYNYNLEVEVEVFINECKRLIASYRAHSPTK